MATFLGYGHCCFNIAKALDKLEHNVAAFPINQPQITSMDNEDLKLVRKLTLNAQRPDFNAPYLNIWHEFAAAERIGSGPYSLLTFFESDTMDDLRRHHLNYPDRILVASHWAKDVLLNNEVSKPVEVVPMGVDSDLFRPYPYEDLSTVNFINIGKKEVRKGHDILIDAFNMAFEKTDDVILTMIWSNPFLSQEENDQWTSMYKSSKLGDKIRLIDGGVLDDRMFAQTISYADCGIFPTRSEGFGMPILQAMACGLPVIVTNYSAPTEFCKPNNTMLIEIEEKEPAYDGKFFNGTGNWAKYGKDQIDQLIEYMRYVYKNKNIAKYNYGSRAREYAEKLSWENTGRRLVEILRE